MSENEFLTFRFMGQSWSVTRGNAELHDRNRWGETLSGKALVRIAPDQHPDRERETLMSSRTRKKIRQRRSVVRLPAGTDKLGVSCRDCRRRAEGMRATIASFVVKHGAHRLTLYRPEASRG